MKKMRKIMAVGLTLVMVLGFTNSVYANRRFAHHNNVHRNNVHHSNMFTPVSTAQFFTEDGFPVNWQGGFRQNVSGDWQFGRGCWFVDADGNVVSAWGSRMFDAAGNPVPGGYFGGGCWGPGGCWRWQQ
ncbi:MAG: hypothetical protein FWG63_07395 [Defluviitaleaceae bacterium]|nr:hypothetical protein [Defluviitaleaceae bacterium]